jgi:phosphate transport system permease protein
MAVTGSPILAGKYKERDRRNTMLLGMVIVLSILTIIPIVLITGQILIKGIGQINFNFFVQTSPDPLQAMAAVNNKEVIPGGIANGIAGTFMIVSVASVIAIPLGLMTGVYLSENKRKFYSGVIRNISDILQGIPSIVLGIISYLWIVKNVTKGFSAFAGSVALAIMMLPIIIRSTEETINMIPREIREAAYAMGTPYHRVILKVLIPAGLSGLTTGILLSLSRILGETAPLIMTALGSSAINFNITKPTSAIPLLIWEFYNDPYMINLVWSSALFLMFLVLSLNVVSSRVASKNNSGIKR